VQTGGQQERVRSFQAMKRCGEEQLHECSDQLLKKLFKLHIDHLSDAYTATPDQQELIIAVEDSLITLIQFRSRLLDKFLDDLIPSVSKPIFCLMRYFRYLSIW
jgi:hypothetical protein